MRRAVLLSVVGALCAGCGMMPGSRVRPGFRAEFIMPPIIRQESEFLVEESGQTRRAMPLSQTLPPWNTNVSQDSRFCPADLPREVYRQPAAFMQGPILPPAPPAALQQMFSAPPPPPDSFTAEEICELLTAIRRRPAARSAPQSLPPPAPCKMPPASREGSE